MANEKGSITYAFDDTATRLGPLSQVMVGLGTSWASRILISDSQEMHDVLVNSALDCWLSPPTTRSGTTNATSKRLGSNPTDVIDVLNDLRLTTFDAIASTTFGTSFSGVRISLDYPKANPTASPSARPEIPKIAADLGTLFDTIGDGVLFPAPRFLPWLTRTFNRKWRKAITSTHDYLLLSARQASCGARSVRVGSEAEIIDELTALALGGSETIASTMQWCVKILCKHPNVQRKLRTQLFTKLPAIAARPPTFTEISDYANLPYLHAVLYEIRVARQLESDGARDVTDGLDGVRSASSKQRRRTGYWSSKDVHPFDPERRLRADGSFDPNAGPWLPFSCGFRRCFGQKLALLELRLFLSMIQVNFFLDAIPEEMNTWKNHETATNHPQQQC
ncbi:cytochrome P450 [Favolaschia claudopus]|uniref:Cytochrome P450 n=1 Tax=Favolaschia claudopus TaxID=2862362 RepID=A0AAW0DTL4_9AGAR